MALDNPFTSRRLETPWLNEEEFTHMKKWFTQENDTCSWRYAVDQLLVWKARSGLRLQDVFDLSLSILTDLISLESSEASSSQGTIHSAAMTLVRFVSLLTKALPQDQVDKSSIAELANQIDVPEWIVDLRHSIVHGKLPTRQMIAKGLFYAKSYLSDKFWMIPENCQIVAREDDSQVQEELKDLVYSIGKSKKAEDGDPDKKIYKLINKSCEHYTTFISMLVERLTSQLIYPNVDLAISPVIPKWLASKFDKTLDLLSNHQMLTEFIASLSDVMTSDISVTEWLAVAWMDICMEMLTPEDLLGIQDIVLKCCTENQSPLTEHLLSRFLTMRSENDEDSQVCDALHLGEIYTNDEHEEMGVSDEIYTLDTVLQKIQGAQSRGLKVTDLQTKDNPWQIADSSTDWSRIPIGHVFCGDNEKAHESFLLHSKKVMTGEENSSDAIQSEQGADGECLQMEWSRETLDKLKRGMVLL